MPPAEIVKKDLQERQLALFGFSLQSVLDLVSVNCEAVLEESHRLSIRDFHSVLEKIVLIQRGLASMTVPFVGSLLERAISARLELRTASVPKESREALRSLLLLDPMSKDHWGSMESVQEKIRAVKEPVVVVKDRRPWYPSGFRSSFGQSRRSFGARRGGFSGAGRGQWSDRSSAGKAFVSENSSRGFGQNFRGRSSSSGGRRPFRSFGRSK